jgi:hypothetical protein
VVFADLYECPACSLQLLRPGLSAVDRDPPTCGCGLLMRPAGRLIW